MVLDGAAVALTPKEFELLAFLAQHPGRVQVLHRTSAKGFGRSYIDGMRAALTDTATWFSASRGRVTRWPALPAPPAIWHMDTIELHGFEPGFYVDVSAWMPVSV